ncbi:type VII secretion integral membrane protein EccD [Pseudonocardia sp. TRM90224]|uniref:type VII secretion integral membrane protein EccD n=1 Tax=Pseudonocardia sp. TRM90224 TaxID=2812678 RepID=UPI001E453A4B|nr:type VII secretion integral membrane protein EccD [Pseudonocardia sp. TRM90224]
MTREQHYYCRLTVLAPRARVDVALPADVPVAELVPMVMELVGEPRSNAMRPLPWQLSGAAGGPLPPAATLGELGVLDGEQLRLAPLTSPPPPPVFDDPVVAVAATAGRGGLGDRRFGAAAVLVLAAGAAATLAAAGPGAAIASGLAWLGAAGCIGLVLRQVRHPAPLVEAEVTALAARTAALAAVPLAGAGGWTLLQVPTGAALLTAVGAAGTVAAIAQVVLRVIAPALVGIVVAAGCCAVGIVAMRFGGQPAAAAAGVAAAALVAGAVLPRAAIRLAGLPRPLVPTEGTELVDADAAQDLLPPAELAERADLARGYLAGLVGGCAAAAGLGALVAATASSWAGPAFALVTVVVLALRSRGYADAAPARASLVAAIATGLTGLLVAAALGGPDALPTVAFVLLTALGAALLALGRARVPGSPVLRRATDLAEGLLVAAAVPLALAAMDLYRIVRGL